jgi:uncharacterized RDD family membrane protein YckC
MICRNHVEVTEGVRRCSRCSVPYCGDCLVDIAGQPYCAICKSERLLDVRSGVDATRLDFASPWKRFAAIFLDGLIVNLPIYLGSILTAMAIAGVDENNPLLTFVFIPLMFAQFFYEGAMMAAKRGVTLGKMAVKVRVVRPDGSPISTGQAWGRAAMKLLFGCISIFDYLPAFFTKERTTLHDLVAGTRVIESY